MSEHEPDYVTPDSEPFDYEAPVWPSGPWWLYPAPVTLPRPGHDDTDTDTKGPRG